jgi:hypothetical protein
MFAAGSGATGAIAILLDAAAAIGARDRRGRTALDYAPKGSAAEQLLRWASVGVLRHSRRDAGSLMSRWS